MKSTNNKGFTLVELIIVITILAILATIAFISFQGYAADARDGKRKAEVGSIRNLIEVKLANGSSVTSFAKDNSSSGVVSIGGTGVTTSDYKAGLIDFVALGANEKNYVENYRIGVSANAGGVYQIATKSEKEGTAYVVGNYNPRTLTGTTFSINSKPGYFKMSDYVSWSGAKITGISSDLTTLTVMTGSTTYTLTGGVNIGMLTAESLGLIKSSSGANLVTNGGSDLAY